VIFCNRLGTKSTRILHRTCAYLNINSLRYKVGHIKELPQKGTVDILFLAETKLDPSPLPFSSLSVDGIDPSKKESEN
jgi:exonuclease III